ncbi:glycosyltransferase [Caldimonas tepidiphila]|uniref:glycosyltransferase n=1 Tax=Caldimonas tepidiphila TaxID=2315841 RepID=UPI000E5C0326|nr:glycosyltransferase [Caldimonas tepidiphila]
MTGRGDWRSPPQRIVVLSQGDNASWAYLLQQRLACQGLPVVHADPRLPPRGAAAVPRPGDAVVICRYLSLPWRTLLGRLRSQLAGVVYFMDDDLLDAGVLRELPWRYALKVFRGATMHRRWLERHCDAFWVSTPALARRYAALRPEVLPLRPAQELLQAAPAPVRICYHGSLPTHRRELEWLRPVIEAVQRRCAHTHVELFGDVSVQRLYRGLPRVSVVHQLSWPGYLDYSAACPRDIGLAPLRPSRFNAARGAVKFFDFARMGAVGLYADGEPYAGWVRHEEDGLLLDHEPQTWVRHIVALVEDAPRRERMAAAARRRALEAARPVPEPGL